MGIRILTIIKRRLLGWREIDTVFTTQLKEGQHILASSYDGRRVAVVTINTPFKNKTKFERMRVLGQGAAFKEGSTAISEGNFSYWKPISGVSE